MTYKKHRRAKHKPDTILQYAMLVFLLGASAQQFYATETDADQPYASQIPFLGRRYLSLDVTMQNNQSMKIRYEQAIEAQIKFLQSRANEGYYLFTPVNKVTFDFFNHVFNCMNVAKISHALLSPGLLPLIAENNISETVKTFNFNASQENINISVNISNMSIACFGLMQNALYQSFSECVKSKAKNKSNGHLEYLVYGFLGFVFLCAACCGVYYAINSCYEKIKRSGFFSNNAVSPVQEMDNYNGLRMPHFTGAGA